MLPLSVTKRSVSGDSHTGQLQKLRLFSRYFDQWISGVVERGLPGKLNIMQFKKANAAVQYGRTICNKVKL